MKDGHLSITALDPGGTTGVAFYDADVIFNVDDQIEYLNPSWDTLQLVEPDHHKTLRAILERRHVANTIVVCESFQYRRPVDAPAVELISCEYIGVVKLVAQERPDIQVVWQTPGKVIPPKNRNRAGGFWTDEKLKQVGKYSPGRKHANDAMRHLLHFMAFSMGRRDLLEPLR